MATLVPESLTEVLMCVVRKTQKAHPEMVLKLLDEDSVRFFRWQISPRVLPRKTYSLLFNPVAAVGGREGDDTRYRRRSHNL